MCIYYLDQTQGYIYKFVRLSCMNVNSFSYFITEWCTEDVDSDYGVSLSLWVLSRYSEDVCNYPVQKCDKMSYAGCLSV